MNAEVNCPACGVKKPDTRQLTANDLRLLQEMIDTQGWQVYREIVQFGALQAVDMLLVETDPSRLETLRQKARLWVFLSQFDTWVRARLEETVMETDTITAAFMDYINRMER